jgi:IS5 family transposase
MTRASANEFYHSTIWRFRQLLNTENLLEALLEQINHHLEQNSIIVSLGSINIIDATVIDSDRDLCSIIPNSKNN